MSQLIRLATPVDGAACAAIYDPVVRDSAISFETDPPTAEDMAARIADYSKVAPWLVYEEESSILGYAYGSKFRPREAYRWCAEASTYLAPEAQGRGIGTRMAQLLIELLRLQGFQSVYSVIALPNPASERLSKKLGMKRVGVLPKAGFKLGEWHDVAQWHMELNPATANPPEPKSPVECDAMPEWQALLDAANSA